MITDSKHVDEILDELFRRVGAKREEIDITKHGWYQEREWTTAEEMDFIVWLTDYLVEHRLCAKSRAEREARKLSAFYGWKNSDVK